MRFKSLKGIQDILPPEIYIWQYIEHVSREVFKKYGYQEIRLPIIESTDVFTRSIGETTDIVEKEMYTFLDKGNRSITLRPEGTAPFVRTYVEHHLYNEPSPQKYYYMGPMFRYERPQAFRYRQFYQIGVEALGTEDPKLDAEVISMLTTILKKIGLREFNIEITSIGCQGCRPDYRKALKKNLQNRLNLFCEDCQRRFEFNPLRILDCKVSSCIEVRKDSPAIINFLCDNCKQHLEEVRRYLELLSIPYIINPDLVRGLDYYTRTAFEVTSESLGSQKAVAAGGRYDRLVNEFGGPPTPGIGFAIGIERIIPLIKKSMVEKECPDLFFCSLGKEASKKSFILTEQLRGRGLWVEMSYDEPSLRSQMRKADRIGAKNVIVLGEDELKKRKVIIKDMRNKKETKVTLESEEILKAVIIKQKN
jgi:histidyl-tRNA synthetase